MLVIPFIRLWEKVRFLLYTALQLSQTADAFPLSLKQSPDASLPFSPVRNPFLNPHSYYQTALGPPASSPRHSSSSLSLSIAGKRSFFIRRVEKMLQGLAGRQGLGQRVQLSGDSAGELQDGSGEGGTRAERAGLLSDHVLLSQARRSRVSALARVQGWHVDSCARVARCSS